MKKIIFTGGTGRFAKVFKNFKTNYKVFYPNKKNLNINKLYSIKRYVSKIKPDYLIHCAALSRPMSIHDNNINKSIDTNIIGTSNIVKICNVYKVKLIIDCAKK